jgi:hypothetical protein
MSMANNAEKSIASDNVRLAETIYGKDSEQALTMTNKEALKAAKHDFERILSKLRGIEDEDLTTAERQIKAIATRAFEGL